MPPKALVMTLLIAATTLRKDTSMVDTDLQLITQG